MASIRRPSTIGKIEAWMFNSHEEFTRYRIYERPQQGMGYQYPVDIYFRDLKNLTDVGG